MSTWTAADHPRGDGGRFKPKAHTEPEGELEADQRVSTPTTDLQGTVTWRRRDGVLHRTDGPAVIWLSGGLEWWEDGKRHRSGGPAVTKSDGVEWWEHGKRHRTDGPAVTTSRGTFEWWLNGELQWWENGERKPPEVEATLTMLWRARTPNNA